MFKGAPYQKGFGLGGAFRRFFSWMVPIFKKHALPVINDGLREVGKSAVSTAADIVKDTTSGRNLKESIQERVNSAVDILKEKADRKLSGGSLKKKNLGIKRSKTTKKGKLFTIIKKKQQLKDIFDKS